MIKTLVFNIVHFIRSRSRSLGLQGIIAYAHAALKRLIEMDDTGDFCTTLNRLTDTYDINRSGGKFQLVKPLTSQLFLAWSVKMS